MDGKSNQIQPSILRIDPFDPPHSSVSFLNKVSLGVVPGVRGGGVQGLPNRQKIKQKKTGGNSLEIWMRDHLICLKGIDTAEMIPFFGSKPKENLRNLA